MFTLPINGVHIGKTIDGAMKQNPFFNFYRIIFIGISTNAIRHKVSDFHQIIIARKIDVRKEIHFFSELLSLKDTKL